MKNNSCVFDPITNTLTITKAFADALSNPASAEYQLYRQIKADNPTVAVRKRTHRTSSGYVNQYGCCYYYCKCFTLGAFGDGVSNDELMEICELSHELADEIVAYNIERHKPRTPKEEFELWFNTSS